MAGSDRDDAPAKAGPPSPKAVAGAWRSDRLAAAMRENLRRRKSQRRAREDEAAGPGGAEEREPDAT